MLITEYKKVGMDMVMITRDMTAEEEVEYNRRAAEIAQAEIDREPTAEERLRADVDFLLAMGGML